MSIISDVKCARCDRQYSGVRSRCPYCGARRIGSGKYSEDGGSTRSKMLIGVLFLAILVVAAGILLFTTPPKPGIDDELDLMETETESHGIPDDLGTVRETGTGPSVIPSEEVSETPTETPTPTPVIESIQITYAGLPNNDFSAPVGSPPIPLRVRIEPVGIEINERVIWTSSDTSVFDVVADNPEGTSATVNIIGSGTERAATLTVSIGGIEDHCIVRIN